jgi:hypothetical protein
MIWMKETEIVWIKELFSYYFEKNINLFQNYYKYTVYLFLYFHLNIFNQICFCTYIYNNSVS